MFKWYKKRQEKKINDIANAVVQKLHNQQGWKKFLPPVAMRDKIYMVTENGEIYCMYHDQVQQTEMIMKITEIN
jgi:hypothetical protein